MEDDTTGRRRHARKFIQDKLASYGRSMVNKFQRGIDKESMMESRQRLGPNVSMFHLHHYYSVSELNDHLKKYSIPRASSYTTKELALEAIWDYYHKNEEDDLPFERIYPQEMEKRRGRKIKHSDRVAAATRASHTFSSKDQYVHIIDSQSPQPKSEQDDVDEPFDAVDSLDEGSDFEYKEEEQENEKKIEEPPKKKSKYNLNTTGTSTAASSSTTDELKQGKAIAINISNPLNCTFNFM